MSEEGKEVIFQNGTPWEQWLSAVNAAQAEVAGVIGKGGKNSAMGYQYVGHEQVLRHTHKACVLYGIIIGAPKLVNGPTVIGPKGNILMWTMLIPVYQRAGHVEEFLLPVTTQANDKAAFVASTAADRTLRLRLFGIAGGEPEPPVSGDPEHDSHGGGVSF